MVVVIRHRYRRRKVGCMELDLMDSGFLWHFQGLCVGLGSPCLHHFASSQFQLSSCWHLQLQLLHFFITQFCFADTNLPLSDFLAA